MDVRDFSSQWDPTIKLERRKKNYKSERKTNRRKETGSYLIGVVFKAYERLFRLFPNGSVFSFCRVCAKGTLHSEGLWSWGTQGQGSGVCACRAVRIQNCSDLGISTMHTRNSWKWKLHDNIMTNKLLRCKQLVKSWLQSSDVLRTWYTGYPTDRLHSIAKRETCNSFRNHPEDSRTFQNPPNLQLVPEQNYPQQRQQYVRNGKIGSLRVFFFATPGTFSGSFQEPSQLAESKPSWSPIQNVIAFCWAKRCIVITNFQNTSWSWSGCWKHYATFTLGTLTSGTLDLCSQAGLFWWRKFHLYKNLHLLHSSIVNMEAKKDENCRGNDVSFHKIISGCHICNSMSNPRFAFKLPGKNSSKTSLSDSAVNLAGRRLVKLRFGDSEIHGIFRWIWSLPEHDGSCIGVQLDAAVLLVQRAMAFLCCFLRNDKILRDKSALLAIERFQWLLYLWQIQQTSKATCSWETHFWNYSETSEMNFCWDHQLVAFDRLLAKWSETNTVEREGDPPPHIIIFCTGLLLVCSQQLVFAPVSSQCMLWASKTHALCAFARAMRQCIISRWLL